MKCSATVFFLTFITWISIGFYAGGGYAALSQTLVLFSKYGPIKGRGNPALDDPPNMWYNPDTQQWEPIDQTKPGNRVPQVFAGIQYFLIAWAAFMAINSLVFLIDSIRSKKAVRNRLYQGKRTSDSAISCTAWLVGYCIFLAVIWFIQCCFCVLPILEFRITMQRCWDLDNPLYSSTSQDICVDLVQYGLILYKDTHDDGYALVCGPGGSYNPPRGDLAGFCQEYYPTFVAYLIAFAGGSMGMITMMLFAIRHASNFSYLKIRRFEGPVAAIRSSSQKSKSRKNTSVRTISSRRSQPLPESSYQYEAPVRKNGVELYNPNYGSSVMPIEQPAKPVPEVMSFPRYQTDGEDEDIEMQTIMTEKDRDTYYRSEDDEVSALRNYRGRYSPDSHRSDERLVPRSRSPSPPPYDRHEDDASTVDSRGEHHDKDRSHRRYKGRKHARRSNSRARSDRSSRRHGSSAERTEDSNDEYASSRRRSHRSRHRNGTSDEDEISARASTDDECFSKASSHRRRGHTSRNSTRSNNKRKPRGDESPPSDYYMNEDRERSRSLRGY